MAIEQKHADAIAFGRLFIANPDLVERIKGNRPLNPFDRSTFYGGAEPGYTDYKTFREAALMPSHIPLNLKRLDQKDRVALTDS